MTGHAFLPVNGHHDDDECTHREDGTDATYCGEPEAAHLPASMWRPVEFDDEPEMWEDALPVAKRLSVKFAWYDLWVGAFYDRKVHILYVCPLPCLLITYRFPEASWYAVGGAS